MNKVIVTSLFAGAITVLLTASPPMFAETAEAKSWKRSHGHSAHQRKRAKKSTHRYTNRNGDLPPDRAVFASQVDLNAPGGVQRYFELLNEETR